MYAALLAMIAEDHGRELATSIAVDTAFIDKEIAGYIFRQALLKVGHLRKLSRVCSDNGGSRLTIQAGARDS